MSNDIEEKRHQVSHETLHPETGSRQEDTDFEDLNSFIESDLAAERKGLSEKKRQASAHISKTEMALKRGDLEEAVRSLGRLEGTLAREIEIVKSLREKIAVYSMGKYLSQGFHEAFVAACSKEGLAVEGTFPRYEIFPFRVCVSVVEKSVEVNERRVRILRPHALADYLKRQKSKLETANFNAQRFLDALASVYDLLIRSRQVNMGVKISQDSDLPLMDVYEALTPLPSQRRFYSVNMFAFDLHRLFVADAFRTSDGRYLVLGDTRSRGQRLVTYDASGREHRFGSLRFEERAQSIPSA